MTFKIFNWKYSYIPVLASVNIKTLKIANMLATCIMIKCYCCYLGDKKEGNLINFRDICSKTIYSKEMRFRCARNSCRNRNCLASNERFQFEEKINCCDNYGTHAWLLKGKKNMKQRTCAALTSEHILFISTWTIIFSENKLNSIFFPLHKNNSLW